MPLIVGTLSILSAVFLSHYSALIAPHYPSNFDQPDYIWHVYTAYYKGFVIPADVGETATQIGDLANFKGFVLEALGLLAMLLFGPSRTALAMGNVVLFWALGLALASYVGRLFRPRVGLFAFGLMLFSHGLTMIPAAWAICDGTSAASRPLAWLPWRCLGCLPERTYHRSASSLAPPSSP